MLDVDLDSLIARNENAYLEFKSAFEGPPGAKKRRKAEAIREDIAEAVAALANAEGGVLLVGVEDDGEVTGCSHDHDRVLFMLAVPESRLAPPLPSGKAIQHGDRQILVFEVQSATAAVMVIGSGFPRRVGTDVFYESEEAINAIKARARTDSKESEVVAGAGLEALDSAAIAAAKGEAGLAHESDAQYLIARGLAERRGTDLLLKLGALLLFAKSAPSIPVANASVRVFAVRGKKRETGPRNNSEQVARIEGSIPTVIQETYSQLKRRISTSTKLHDLFFRETPEYPTFAWQEAVVNAVAHRDYRTAGRGVEVWLFDDRMEVVSPGGLLPSITVDQLERREMAHESRNPRIARVLAELGFMREQGEGVARMFEEMERSLLRLPLLVSEASNFKVTLFNEPIFETAEPKWVEYVRALPIRDRQKRILVAFRGSAFTSANYQEINRVDRDEAYREVTELVELGYVTSSEKRGRGATYTVVDAGMQPTALTAEESLAVRLRSKGSIQNADYRELFNVERRAAITALAGLVDRGVLVRTGERRGARYSAGPEFDRWVDAAKRP
jgi:ATP-dependent DNA helicase RecG